LVDSNAQRSGAVAKLTANASARIDHGGGMVGSRVDGNIIRPDIAMVSPKSTTLSNLLRSRKKGVFLT